MCGLTNSRQTPLSECRRFGTCCPPGISLKGTPDTKWHRCAVGHGMTGSKEVGFECCVKGSIFDGTICERPEPPLKPEPAPCPDKCPNGKKLVDGKCQCPKVQE